MLVCYIYRICLLLCHNLKTCDSTKEKKNTQRLLQVSVQPILQEGLEWLTLNKIPQCESPKRQPLTKASVAFIFFTFSILKRKTLQKNQETNKPKKQQHGRNWAANGECSCTLVLTPGV